MVSRLPLWWREESAVVRGIEQLGDRMIAAGSPFSAPLIAYKSKDRDMTQVKVVGILKLMAISSQVKKMIRVKTRYA